MPPVRIATFPLYRTPDHIEPTALRAVEKYVGLSGQRRICLVDDLGRVWHYDSSEVEHVGWGGKLKLVNVDPEWEARVHSFFRPRRPRTLSELKRTRGHVGGLRTRSRAREA